MAIHHHLLLTLLVASILHHASSNPINSTEDATPTSAATAYDILEQNKLPRGLLPLGVASSYVLHKGAMEVTLPAVCDFFVTVAAGRKYLIRYDPTVGGVIQPGLITQVYGVRFQGPYGLFLAFDQVSRTGDQVELYFADTYQKYTRSFPVSAFARSAKCT